MTITYDAIVSETDTTTTSSRVEIQNGQIDYAAELLMEFDTFGLSESFDFNFKQIRTIDDDSTQDSLDDSTITQSQLSESFYLKFINGTYNTGITPYKISVYTDGAPIDYVLGWAHGEIERPSFESIVETDASFSEQSYSVSHFSEEIETIQAKYDKGNFTDNFSSFISTVSKSVYNRMTINVSQGLEFQKNKIGKIDLKKTSPTPAQNVTVSSIGSAASISSGGY
jgi:hypothetical protein